MGRRCVRTLFVLRLDQPLPCTTPSCFGLALDLPGMGTLLRHDRGTIYGTYLPLRSTLFSQKRWMVGRCKQESLGAELQQRSCIYIIIMGTLCFYLLYTFTSNSTATSSSSIYLTCPCTYKRGNHISLLTPENHDQLSRRISTSST